MKLVNFESESTSFPNVPLNEGQNFGTVHSSED